MDEIPKRMVFYGLHSVMVTMERVEQSNQVDVEPKLKMMIIEHNALDEVAFLQSNLSSYKVMDFDTTSTKTSNDQNGKIHDFDPKRRDYNTIHR